MKNKKTIFMLASLVFMLSCNAGNKDANDNDEDDTIQEKTGWYTENITQATMSVNFAPFDGEMEYHLFYTYASDWGLANDTELANDVSKSRLGNIDATEQYTLSELNNLFLRVFTGNRYDADETQPFHFTNTDLPITLSYPGKLENLTYGNNTELLRNETYIDGLDRFVRRGFDQVPGLGRGSYNVFTLAYKTSTETKYHIKFLNLATILDNPGKFLE